MYLLYLDESGEAGGWRTQKHFVLGGVAVHEGQIYALSQKLAEIQSQYFPGISVPIAFHATEIRHGKGQFKDFQPYVREKILESVYRLILDARFPNLIAFATTLSISAAQNPTQVRRDTFEEVCSQFNNFLIWQYRLEHPSKGLLIIDENRAEQYRHLLEEFHQVGTKYGYLGNIIDIPYFARCHETRMLQLADLCVNAVFRYYEKQDDRYLKILLPRLARNPQNQILYGLKHITNDKSCTCFACIST